MADTKWKKGQSGNPKGRPVGTTSYKSMVQEAFVDIMQSKTKNTDGKEEPYYKVFLEKMKDAALKPDTKAFSFMAERLLTDDVLDQIDRQLTKSRKEDEDFMTYRIHKKCFDIQRQILLSKETYNYLMAGRRSGKSETDKLAGVQKAVSIPGAKILYIGLSFLRCLDIFWTGIIKELDELGIELTTKDRSEGHMVLQNGSEIFFRGNTTIDDRDKLRGSKWHLIIIDEAQSQKALPTLLNEILKPTLIDYNGQIILSGSGPRVRGTYWEQLWSDQTFKAARWNWNLTQNPYIPNYTEVLEKIKEEEHLTDSSPLFIREYLGKICYDDDALVYRLTSDNYFDDTSLQTWINAQPRADIHFTAGLDYGFCDSDAFVVTMFSTSLPEKFIVYEHKGNRTGITELANKIKEGIEYVNNNPLFSSIPDKHFYIYSDSGGAGKKISFELSQQFGLPCLDAYKTNKDFAIELLQEEVRRGLFKVREGSNFADEALKTVWARNDKDELTRIIDDDVYHPDEQDAILYSLRYVWQNYGGKNFS